MKKFNCSVYIKYKCTVILVIVLSVRRCPGRTEVHWPLHTCGKIWSMYKIKRLTVSQLHATVIGLGHWITPS